LRPKVAHIGGIIKKMDAAGERDNKNEYIRKCTELEGREIDDLSDASSE